LTGHLQSGRGDILSAIPRPTSYEDEKKHYKHTEKSKQRADENLKKYCSMAKVGECKHHKSQDMTRQLLRKNSQKAEVERK
jgi:hypothetical protein